MSSANYLQIPDQNDKNDFTIIYKGREDDNGEQIEKIDQIQTSKNLLIKSLQYFREKKFELQYQDGIYIHDVYPNSIFKNFIESIRTRDLYFTDEKTMLQYYELSQKYGYKELTDVIKRHIDEQPNLKEIFNQLSNKLAPDEPINTEKEEILAQHLDFCLKNINLKILPIQMIIRIINSPKRVLNNHHLLFQFVKEMIDFIKKNDIKNFQYISLFTSSLDFNQMDVEEIESLLNDEYSSDFFNPLNGIKCLINRIKTKDEIINAFDSKIENIQNYLTENKKIEDKQKEEFIKLQNDFNQFKNNKFNSLENHQLKLEEIQKQQIEIQKEELNKIRSELNDFKDLTKKKVEENENVNKQFLSQFDSIKDNQQKQKEDLNKFQLELNEFKISKSNQNSYTEQDYKQFKSQFEIVENEQQKLNQQNQELNEIIQKLKKKIKKDKKEEELEINQIESQLNLLNINQQKLEQFQFQLNEHQNKLQLEISDFKNSMRKNNQQYEIQKAMFDKKIEEINNYYDEQIDKIKETEEVERKKLKKQIKKYLNEIEFQKQNQIDNKDARLNNSKFQYLPKEKDDEEIDDIDPYHYHNNKNDNNMTTKKGRTVFIKNVPFSATAKDLYNFLNKKFGEVNDVQILQKINHGKPYSRGIGFVEFDSPKDCQKAVCAQNVEFKIPSEPKPHHLDIMRKNDTVFIKGIPPGTKNKDIINAFKSVKPFKIKFVRYNNDSFLGFAFAQFSSEEDRENALQQNSLIHINQSKSKVLPARIITSQCFRHRRRHRWRAPKCSQNITPQIVNRPQNIRSNTMMGYFTDLLWKYAHK